MEKTTHGVAPHGEWAKEFGVSSGKHFSNGEKNAERAYGAENYNCSGSTVPESGAHAAGAGYPVATSAPNTTDPFSPDYVDPALTAHQRKKERKRQARVAQRRVQSGEPEGSGSRGWTFVYIIGALVITVLVWFLLGNGA